MRTNTKLMLCCFLVVCFGCRWAEPLEAQSAPKREDAAILFQLGYGPQLPLGDLSDRFGSSWAFSGSLDWLLSERTLQLGLQTQYFFGTNVKEDVLSGLRTVDGFIIGNDRSPADIQQRMRGIYVGLRLSTMLHQSDNRRTGILLRLGAGYLQHRIRIQDDPERTVNQLVGAYRQGYDQLSGGPAFYQFIGWQQLNPQGSVNFYIGLEAWQAFTQPLRDFNFSTLQATTGNRFDALLGIRLGWILPFYLSNPDTIYY